MAKSICLINRFCVIVNIRYLTIRIEDMDHIKQKIVDEIKDESNKETALWLFETVEDLNNIDYDEQFELYADEFNVVENAFSKLCFVTFTFQLINEYFIQLVGYRTN